MGSLHHLALLAALLVPLALDTFILSAALGVVGLPRRLGVRASLVLASFEAAMPIVGVVLGRGLGGVVGHFAGYTAAVAIGVAGFLLLRSGGDEERERERVRLLARARGFAIVDLGISISLDELAIGFSLGLLHLSLPVAVAFLGVQAFVASQLGLWIGGRIAEELREGAERLAGLLLIGTAALLLALKLAGYQL